MAQLKIRGLQNIYHLKESEAEEIKEVWNNDQFRPDHKINLGPLSFKKSDIQLIEMGSESTNYRIDLSDSVQREEIRQFEKEFESFQESQPENKRSFEHWLISKRIIGFRPPRDDFKRVELSKIWVFNPNLFTEYNKKYSALMAMKSFAERQLPTDLETQKETLFESEEINVKDIPF